MLKIEVIEQDEEGIKIFVTSALKVGDVYVADGHYLKVVRTQLTEYDGHSFLREFGDACSYFNNKDLTLLLGLPLTLIDDLDILAALSAEDQNAMALIDMQNTLERINSRLKGSGGGKL